MLINNVTIENFRCYYGKNDITLNKDGKITLIYGDSGYGKSSFLQFFRWMFYGTPDFGTNNDKPVYNIKAFSECMPGKNLKLLGQVRFEHLGVQYSLIREEVYKVGINIKTTNLISSEYVLKTLIDDNWQIITGDVANKINSILPKGLAKYFLLDGERARDIVLNSKDLKQAIHALFGIDAYANASDHLGHRNKKNSVIGHYYSLMLSKMSSAKIDNMTAFDLQNTIQELNDDVDELRKRKTETISQSDELTAKNDEILKIIGAANSKDNIRSLIKANEDIIKANEETIAKTKKAMGDLFYKNFPYLFLSRKASQTSAILREKKKDFANCSKNIFENLKKELLKEILDKNVCVCGKGLDDVAIKHIENIMATMPPDSYAYQFGQFVSKARKQIQSSQFEIMKYEELSETIAKCEEKIARCEQDNKERLAELKRLEEVRDYVEELEKNKEQIKSLSKLRSQIDAKIAEKKQTMDIAGRRLTQLTKNQTVSSYYNGIITFLEDLKKVVEFEKIEREEKVKETLNSCVREVFKKLTTQTELDVDKIRFVNDDFSLRTTYLTGGQLAIDEYSYVIGIVKALQEFNMETNENPIIIDAPFAFTGTEQSEHIFKMLPTVSKQTVLLTLDLNKIKSLLKEDNMYDFYIIDNQTQDQATIRRASINDIKF